MTTMSVEILHISSAGVLKAEDQPARYTLKLGVRPDDFDDQILKPVRALWLDAMLRRVRRTGRHSGLYGPRAGCREHPPRFPAR